MKLAPPDVSREARPGASKFDWPNRSLLRKFGKSIKEKRMQTAWALLIKTLHEYGVSLRCSAIAGALAKDQSQTSPHGVKLARCQARLTKARAALDALVVLEDDT